jgi:hypothetical protein
MGNNNRSEAAKKANETRRANKLAQQQYEEDQQKRREWLLGQLTDEQREAIEEELSTPFTCLDDEFENLVTEFYDSKVEEVKDAIRGLLRKQTKASLILAAIEQDWTLKFNLGIYSLVVDAEEILDGVLGEDEFLGMNQDTPEAKQTMWSLTDKTIDDDDRQPYIEQVQAETAAA